MSDVLDKLAAEVAEGVTVMASATTLIEGIAARVQAAVDKALENGATAEQLKPVTAEIAALSAGADALSDAVLKNTPAAEPPAA